MPKKTIIEEPIRIEKVPVRKILLDNSNPRFTNLGKRLSQDDLARILSEETHLEELLLSIAVNGYYPQEPLLVVKQGDDYVTIEGNRRLAAVKILLNPELAKKVGVGKEDFPPLSSAKKEALKEIPVIKYANREALWSYLSYRHINGPRNWSAISKAEYIADLYLKRHIDFDEIIRNTGDRHKTSIKLFNGLMVLKQGEENTQFSREDFYASKFNFSHLYTIIQFPVTKKFLGIERFDSNAIFPLDPVPESKYKELEELLFWIFGSKSGKIPSIIKSQNPDLRTLDDVLGNKSALSVLRESRDLLSSSEYTEAEDRRLEGCVIRAELNLRKAKSIEDFFKGDLELAEKVLEIRNIANEMYQKMLRKVKKEKKGSK